MEIKTVKVSEKGQIAIPRGIRERIGLKQGDEMIIIEDGSKILLEKSDEISKKIKGDFDDILQLSESSLKEVWNNKEDDIWEEYIK